MLAGVADAFMDDLTQVDPVFEQIEDSAAPEPNPAAMRSACADMDLRPPAFHSKQRRDIAHRAQFKISAKDVGNQSSGRKKPRRSGA